MEEGGGQDEQAETETKQPQEGDVLEDDFDQLHFKKRNYRVIIKPGTAKDRECDARRDEVLACTGDLMWRRWHMEKG